MIPIGQRVKNAMIGAISLAIVVVDSVSYFWSMAGDLLLVGALIAISKLSEKK